MAADRAFDFRRLSIPERLQLVEDIWDSIAQDASPETLPVPDEHKAILDQRFDADERDPEAGTPWRDVLNDITRPKP